MIDNLSGFDIPVSIKQLEQTKNVLPKEENEDLIKEKGPGKIFESFGNILKKHIEETNNLQNTADAAQETFAVGGDVSLHEVMIKTAKAEMAMQLTLQLRNKLISAYKEIENMHV